MIAIVDYGVGNLFSLLSSLRALDLEVGNRIFFDQHKHQTQKFY